MPDWLPKMLASASPGRGGFLAAVGQTAPAFWPNRLRRREEPTTVPVPDLRPRKQAFDLRDPWPVRSATVEAGRWACRRSGCRFRFGAGQLVLEWRLGPRRELKVLSDLDQSQMLLVSHLCQDRKLRQTSLPGRHRRSGPRSVEAPRLGPRRRVRWKPGRFVRPRDARGVAHCSRTNLSATADRGPWPAPGRHPSHNMGHQSEDKARHAQ
jgi:hypothetical protein